MQQHDTKRRFVRAKGLWLTYVLTLSGFTVRNLSNIPRSRSHWNSKWSKPFLCPLLSGCVFERSGVSAQVGPLCGGQTMPCRWETVTLDFGWKSFFFVIPIFYSNSLLIFVWTHLTWATTCGCQTRLSCQLAQAAKTPQPALRGPTEIASVGGWEGHLWNLGAAINVKQW